MSENNKDRQIFSLFEVTRSIGKTISSRYKSNYWIKAEMNKLNHYSHSGHCYPELVEKNKGKVIAEMKATIWSDDFRRIQNNFLKILKEPLKDGINILFCARISFDPAHGLSLNIVDIDPSFSLGELESEKQRTIERLQKEDLFTFGKRFTFPLLPKRIAIISVETSKGYADFLNMLDNNPYKYRFFHMLFPALLQGERAVESINSQLKNIGKVKHHFDVVVIVRGGGGDVGLSCYNKYELAKEIAIFPIPVLTGIGHSTNVTVAEMIAFVNAITPTALADLLIRKFHDYAHNVEMAEQVISSKASRRLSQETLALSNIAKLLGSASRSRILNQGFPLEQIKSRIRSDVTAIFLRNYSLLELLEQKKMAMDPMNVIRRGYSMTLVDGKVLKNINDAREGEMIKTILANGTINSVINQIVAD